jgi:hypothetical protein
MQNRERNYGSLFNVLFRDKHGVTCLRYHIATFHVVTVALVILQVISLEHIVILTVLLQKRNWR